MQDIDSMVELKFFVFQMTGKKKRVAGKTKQLAKENTRLTSS